MPTNDSVLIATYFPQTEFVNIRTDAATAHRDAVRMCAPGLDARMRSARQTGKLWGTGEQRNFFRRASGAGWALIGDAGHHKDSISARGITDALVQAELLVKRIQGKLDNQISLQQGLIEFATDRDILMLPGYHSTLAVAKMELKESRMGLLRGIAANPEYSNVYFDVVAGIRSPADLEAVA